MLHWILIVTSLPVHNKVPYPSNADRFMAEVIPLVNKPGDSATINASFAASQPNSTINDQSMVDLPLHDILPHSNKNNSSGGGSGQAGKAKNRVKHKNVLSSHTSSQFLSKITRSLFNLNHYNYQPIPNDDLISDSTESLIVLQNKSQPTDADGHTGCCCTCSGCFK